MSRDSGTALTRAAVEAPLRRVARRLAFATALSVTAKLLPFLFLALFGREVLQRLALVAGAPLAASALAGLSVLLLACAAAALLFAPDLREVALLVDHRLGTRELVYAAVEAGPEATHPLALDARRGAADLLASGAVAKAFPLVRSRSFAAAGAALLLLLSIPLLPRREAPKSAAARPPAREVRAAGRVLAEATESLAARIDPARQRDLERLKELAQRMERGEVATPEKALTALSRLEKSLASAPERGTSDPAFRSSASKALKELEKEPTGAELARAMESGRGDDLAKALEKSASALEKPGLSAAERERDRKRLADRLSAVAEALREAGEPRLARALEELAKALREGNVAEAQRLLRSFKVSEACKRAGDLATSPESARELAELIQLARYLVGGGTPVPLETTASAGAASGVGSNRAGPLPGVGSTNDAAAGYKTGNPILRERQTGETSDKTGEYEAKYGSQIAKAGSFEDVKGSAPLGKNGVLVSVPSLSSAMKNAPSVPLRAGTVAPGAAEGAGDKEPVPVGYRELVRKYFATSGSKSGGKP